MLERFALFLPLNHLNIIKNNLTTIEINEEYWKK